ncbi:putative glycolipid-binding domain-containing protein [Dyadobacter sp. CY261]|uniref:putative glycolipid-binding domain-containing protein n=1 Tax=Dyadobacter sp. CY261 TaxID=2907203 RepID=UPI001F45BB18|nr:putative glycolipid-binding domain-containing protein [Dyadobacter sp. CY261]MCF0072289.1 putative glycolipid-binding domain-containing protein [Dyadobacter sp. CY261]
MIRTNILWTGREYYSLENCRIDGNENGTLIESAIVGQYGDDLYQVNYQIRVNEYWETVLVDISFYINHVYRHLNLINSGEGNWLLNGELNDSFSDCVDIDLPLTPFTNTLPIRRLNIPIGEERPIRVIYLDLLEDSITPVTQKYTRVSETVFHYENVPNDFEADIVLDADGLVVDYPELFVRTVRKDF